MQGGAYGCMGHSFTETHLVPWGRVERPCGVTVSQPVPPEGGRLSHYLPAPSCLSCVTGQSVTSPMLLGLVPAQPLLAAGRCDGGRPSPPPMVDE